MHALRRPEDTIQRALFQHLRTRREADFPDRKHQAAQQIRILENGRN
jgi:hypothetical protein